MNIPASWLHRLGYIALVTSPWLHRLGYLIAYDNNTSAVDSRYDDLSDNIR